MVIVLALTIRDPHTKRVLAHVCRARSITNAGYEVLIRAACDPVRPALINTLGIGWGTGSTTPFDPTQMVLQGAGTSLKQATWTYDPIADRRSCMFAAVWGPNEPVAELILIGELGLFDASGTMIDRTPVTPTPKYPNLEAVVHGVLSFAESQAGYRVI